MPSRSAGILLYRRAHGILEVLAVHPGGPFWERRDEGAWSIPKGEHGDHDDPWLAARREFAEELGREPPASPAIDLGEIRQRAGKVVRAFALEGDLDVDTVVSNTVELEWPPRSGRRRQFPEVDRAAWFTLDEARAKLNAAQVPLLDTLVAALEDRAGR